jgi:hypothetical protein
VRQTFGLAAAAVLGVLPPALWPEWRLVVASFAAALACAGGVLLPSLGLATAGSVFGILIFAVASLTVEAGSALPAALLMGAMVLIVLELAALGEQARGARLGPGVLGATLGRLGAAIALAASLGFLLMVAATFLPLGWSGALRPLVGLAGALIAFAAATRPFLAPYTVTSMRSGSGHELGHELGHESE